MQDDIDWMNASSDLWLAEPFIALAGLSRPLKKMVRRLAPRLRRARRIGASAVRSA